MSHLPIKKKRISVLKSPHVDKKALEQFELKIHKSLFNCTISPLYISNFTKYLILNKPKNIKLMLRLIK